MSRNEENVENVENTGRIAVLITGIIREDCQSIIDNIRNIKEQLKFIGTVDIYFHTWESSNKNTYTEEVLEKIRNEVYSLMTSPCPEKLSPEYNLPLEDPEIHGYNVLCMLYAIGQLCNSITEKYDYMCRMRNDLFIQDDFGLWISFLKLDVGYVCPISTWTFDDCCNDHFGIAREEDFRKIWGRNLFQIKKDFKHIRACPEAILMYKLLSNKLKCYYFIPKLYRYKGDDIIRDYKINIEKLNGYIQNYMRQFVQNYNTNRIFTFKD